MPAQRRATEAILGEYISLRPADTSPILEEDYLLVFLGGQTPPLQKMQQQNA